MEYDDDDDWHNEDVLSYAVSEIDWKGPATDFADQAFTRIASNLIEYLEWLPKDPGGPDFDRDHPGGNGSPNETPRPGRRPCTRSGAPTSNSAGS